MNKYTYSVLGLCILSLIFLGVTLAQDKVDTEDNVPVDLGVDYTNGTHLGYINSFKNESGRTYLSIDFLQSFATKKGSFMASIEDGVCSLPALQQNIQSQHANELNKKNVSEAMVLTEIPEALLFFGKLSDSEIEDFARLSGCFPKGINYTRNRSMVERERIVSPAFRATLEGEVVTYENIILFLNRKKSENTEPLTYMITLKNSIVTKLDVVQK